MRDSLRTLVVLSIALMLGACAAVPMRTMWEMSRMGSDAILEADPAEIRVAMMSDQLFLDEGVDDEPHLIVSLHEEAEIQDRFEFRLVEHTDAKLHRLRSPADGQAWRVFAMADDEYEQFMRMQRQVGAFLERDDPRQLGLGVNPGPGSDAGDEAAQQVPEDGGDIDPERRAIVRRWADDGIPLSIDLQLSAERGYFTLLRDARLPFTLTDDGASGGSD